MSINALLAGAPEMAAGQGSGPQMSMAPGSMFAPALDINNILGTPQATPQMSMAPSEMFAPAFNINDVLGGSANFAADPTAYEFGTNWWE
jgi:hypothetical protein